MTGPIGYNLTPQFKVLMANLNAEIKLIKNRSQAGLIKAAIHIRRSTEDSPPITPLDTGNLRASWFTVTPQSEVPDPLGLSGNFHSKKATGVKANEMKKEYHAAIAEAKRMTAGDDPVVIMGYAVTYAAPVHEMVEVGEERWSRKDSGPKWLETHIYRDKDIIVKKVADEAKIKG